MTKILKFPGNYNPEENGNKQRPGSDQEPETISLEKIDALCLAITQFEDGLNEKEKQRLKFEHLAEVRVLTDADIMANLNAFSPANFNKRPGYYYALYDEYVRRELFTLEK